jgi:uracil-DNA glycosylase
MVKLDEKTWMGILRSFSKEHPEWAPFARTLPFEYAVDLAREMANTDIKSPNIDKIFVPFSDLRPSDIKAVILGQDPYPDIEMAIGRAFAIPANKTPTISLRNIIHQCGSNVDCSLSKWIDQGVFLINASPVLTDTSMKETQAWTFFTAKLIKFISEQCDDVTFIFMGKLAQTYCKYIGTNSRARVVNLPHPAARGGQFALASPFDQIRRTCPSIDW